MITPNLNKVGLDNLALAFEAKIKYILNKQARIEGMVQVVECLSSKCKTLSSNPSTTKK
jgi:hypothetical protein